MRRACETIELPTNATPDFIPPALWPPNSPDLNLMDYKIWSIMQERVYQSRTEDIDELREWIMAAWEELDQCVINTAVRQWCTYLHACVKAKGDHFEHKLPWLKDEMPDRLFNHSILTVGFYSDFRILIKCIISHTSQTHTYNRLTALLEYVRDHPGEQVPGRLKPDVDVEQMYEHMPLKPLCPTPCTLLITFVYNFNSTGTQEM